MQQFRPTRTWSAKVASSTIHLFPSRPHQHQELEPEEIPPTPCYPTIPQALWVLRVGRISASSEQVLHPLLRVENGLGQTPHGGTDSPSPSSEKGSLDSNPSRPDLPPPFSPQPTKGGSEARRNRISDLYVSSPRGYLRASKSQVDRTPAPVFATGLTNEVQGREEERTSGLPVRLSWIR